MEGIFRTAAYQNHPIRKLLDFLEQEKNNEIAKHYDDMRFIGYVLDIGYDTATIITSDPFKIAVGGLPRNSFLVMTPRDLDGSNNLTPHFTLLRVAQTAPTPLSNETQQTFFELHKKSMPELDVFTQSELQWGALKCSVLGMFYPHPDEKDRLEFSGDVNNIASPYKYSVYAPDEVLLDLIVNSMVPQEKRFDIGHLRPTECRLIATNKPALNVAAIVSTTDFIGARTALFGKTRLGKSNIVKLIAESIIKSTTNHDVGQLIFDINGEYSNDNPQDNNTSLKSVYSTECVVYALTKKANTPSNPLKLNFYEQPASTLPILAQLLASDGQTADYVRSFTSVTLPSISDISTITNVGEQVRAIRKIQMYWATLSAAGFPAHTQLASLLPYNPIAAGFDPGFSKALRTQAYGGTAPNAPASLAELQSEIEAIATCYENLGPADALFAGSRRGSNRLLDADDTFLLRFIAPNPGRSGPSKLGRYRAYHDPKAADFVTDIMKHLDAGKTVLLDLGNANEELVKYFSELLSRHAFSIQQDRFATNKLGDKYIQIYFEEAHNVFPLRADPLSIYSRFAKEGGKFHIGIVYSTQSPSTIYDELLAQTENFFVGHLSSEKEAKAIGHLHVAFSGLDADIMQTRQPGYMRMLTRSHRFAIPVQAHLFKGMNP